MKSLVSHVQVHSTFSVVVVYVIYLGLTGVTTRPNPLIDDRFRIH